MKFSQLYSKTLKDAKDSDVSLNAQLLIRAGYVHKLMAGVYSYLPLGLRVLTKIENIVREEMNALGATEMLMPAIQPRDIWDKTGRWDAVDVLFKLKGAGDRDLALGATHEEVVTPVVTSFVQSYRDLPTATYQVQTKFRNEARAKSGLLRGREFRMKDMYSFHIDQSDLDAFYDRSIEAYKNFYRRCGLGDLTLVTFASGGVFSKYSHEFQAITEYGEDLVYKVPNTDIAINEEVIDDEEALKEIVPNYTSGMQYEFEKVKSIEVGNIFKLGTKYSDAFDASFSGSDGKPHSILMGCYGIGMSRVMGAVAECLCDDKGLVWPEETTPYKVHLITLARDEAERKDADDLYQELTAAGIEVFYDDRLDIRAGQKFGDADLMGMPIRLVMSHKTLKENSVEWKNRTSEDAHLVPLSDLKAKLLG